jgi:hypothetical protein
MFDIDREVAVWRGRLGAKGKLSADALAEMESHLRDEIDDLLAKGLAADEAFLISVKRIGNVDAVAREFGRGATEELWKRLVLMPEDEGSKRELKANLIVTIVLAAVAGFAAKIPDLLGGGFASDHFMRNFMLNAWLFCLPSVALGFLLARKAGWKPMLAYALAFAVSGLALNLYPWAGGDTLSLSVIHAPLCFWLALLPAYCGSDWRNSRRRMDFLRMTGEAFLYGVLLGCGVGVLCAFVIALIGSIGLRAEKFVSDWIGIVGCFAAVVVAARLSQAKRNVIENIAPVLARIFGPFFLAAMLVFLAIMAGTGKNPLADRDILIGFDLMLAVVLALVIYSMSSRDEREAPGFADWVNAGLALAALAIDVVALVVILSRIGDFGFSPNKLAALGENALLVADLSGLAFFQIRSIVRKKGFESVARWQTAMLAPIFAWLALVTLVFPLIFRFA